MSKPKSNQNQSQARERTKTPEEKPVSQDPSVSQAVEKGKKLKGQMDDILDEINEALDENIEAGMLASRYVQRGGE